MEDYLTEFDHLCCTVSLAKNKNKPKHKIKPKKQKQQNKTKTGKEQKLPPEK